MPFFSLLGDEALREVLVEVQALIVWEKLQAFELKKLYTIHMEEGEDFEETS